MLYCLRAEVKKFYKTCARKAMTHGGETWAMREEEDSVLLQAEYDKGDVWSEVEE